MKDEVTDNLEDHSENEDIEVRILLEAIYLKYGYDFRNYSKASLKRRIAQRMTLSSLDNVSDMIHKILYDRAFFDMFLNELSIKVTEMFRDPLFFLAMRKQVIPLLRPLPFIKVWIAGCSTGEEVYSLAILLTEEKLYEKTRIYATDFSEAALNQARDGIYKTNDMKKYTSNYQQAGGVESFVDYFLARYDSAIMDQSLRKNITFSRHNLVTDGVFGEMNLIVCRNVLIYFNRDLQDSVFGLFVDSLCEGGFLALGSKETIRLSRHASNFEDVSKEEKIYCKHSMPIPDVQSGKPAEGLPEGVFNRSTALISETMKRLDELQGLLRSVTRT
ncbi:protein-glutamate O-methyltransferase CheR [Candidatus Magnetobacterium bavaricum]|uniref:Protein-glutamate O-methyltransferase CheR n=1 Tax=Candidatus Magnetobacterium bavaricum TaxID=29290 RepID=A0A0F3GXZ8_9BACT|nr:protein-glutamate O-methyltransferase CheR [Candidatus Magnetobacterium bavaricum]